MEEATFQKQIEKLRKPSGPRGTWDPRVFTFEEYESMTSSQLCEVTVEMLKFTSPGSYDLRGDLFDLIDYLDGKVHIREDPSLEKYLHMTASLVCLTQFQGFPIKDVFPEQLSRLGRHLEKIIGQKPFNVPSMETEPSLQIATFLAYPLLEGVVRRKLPRFITPDGTILCDFEVIGRKKSYRSGDRISNLYHELQLLEKQTQSPSLKAVLADINRVQPLFEDIHEYRNMLLHGELTACWHSLTLLLLTYVILLEEE